MEPVPFLANIILVAHADGQLTSSELGQLEAIRKALRFKKSDFTAAQKLVIAGEHRQMPVGSFADQVKNLELILTVALCDNDLDPAEQRLIKEFAGTIGVTTEQLERMRLDVLASLKLVDQLCPTCMKENPLNARFCGACGSPLAQTSPAASEQFVIPASGIAIEFAESTAASFPKALEIAMASDQFQTCIKGSKTWYLVGYPSGDVSLALPIAELLSGIRNKGVYIHGVEQQWNDVFGFAYCARDRRTAYKPTEYCFGRDGNRLNPWGCHEIRMDWTEWADWFQYGRWEKQGLLGNRHVWRFEKGKIRHQLATNIHRYRFCPHIRHDLIEAVLNHLPDFVDPTNDRLWGYHNAHEQVPGSIKVIEKKRIDGYDYVEEYWADGVKPNGLGALRGIWMRAFKDCNADMAEVVRLLK